MPGTVSARGLQVALAIEVIWAGFLIYEVHDQISGRRPARPGNAGRITMPWDVQVLNFMHDWATPAIAIVVVVWLADVGRSNLHRG